MSDKNEIYVSTDIETDGPCPGLNSMLSLASVAFDPRRGSGQAAIHSAFSANLRLAYGATPDPSTMTWWQTQKDAWAAHRVDPRDPTEVMLAYAEWLAALPGKPIFVGYPASFDFSFVYYYLHRYAEGRNPFVRNAIDIETYVMGVRGCAYLEAGEDAWPSIWFDPTARHTHVALDDATEQGLNFMRIMAYRAESRLIR